MTTPDIITKARKAMDKAYEVCRNLSGADKVGLMLGRAALDLAERLQASIEKLKAERDEANARIASLEEALRPFVLEHEAQDVERSLSVQDTDRPYMFYRATYGDLRRAASVMGE